MHPAMRFIGPARIVLGIPTIMNIVGPLANPLDLETQLMGLYRADLQETAAQVMQNSVVNVPLSLLVQIT